MRPTLWLFRQRQLILFGKCLLSARSMPIGRPRSLYVCMGRLVFPFSFTSGFRESFWQVYKAGEGGWENGGRGRAGQSGGPSVIERLTAPKYERTVLAPNQAYFFLEYRHAAEPVTLCVIVMSQKSRALVAFPAISFLARYIDFCCW